MLIWNSFSFEDKDPRFTRLKSDLALRLLSKELFYIRAMPKCIIFDTYLTNAFEENFEINCYKDKTICKLLSVLMASFFIWPMFSS